MIELDNLAHPTASTAITSRNVEPPHGLLSKEVADSPDLNVLGDALIGPFEKITRLACRLLGTEAATINLLSAEVACYQTWVDIEAGADTESDVEIAVSELTASRPASLNAHEPDLRNFVEPVILGELRIRFYAGMPLVAEDGYECGTLCVFSSEARELTESEIATLRDLAAIAVDEIRLRLSGRRIGQNEATQLGIALNRKRSRARSLNSSATLERGKKDNDERYQSLIGLLSDWHWEQDEYGSFTLIADAGETQTSSQFKQYIGKKFREIREIRMSEKEWRAFDQTISRHQPFQELTFEWNEADKESRYLSVSAQPIFTADGWFKGYRGITKDVTAKIRFQEELTRSNAALREFSEAQQAFREAERKRIAYELHDELAQLLATSRMELCLLQQDLMPASSTQERLRAVDRMIGSSIVSLRKLATDLRPSCLDEGGLYYALRSLLKTISENTGIECHLVATESDLAIDELRSTAIFRMIEECVTNIDRHADARKVVIQLYRSGNAMEIRVQDDGRGIRPEEVEKAKAFGLVEMRERVRNLKGRIDIKGAPGKGTRIAITLPHFFQV